MIELGLPVIYDGKKYTVLWNKETLEYPVGGLICELSRLHPGILKEVFDNYPDRDKPNTRENASNGLCWVFEKMKDVLTLPVHQAIVAGELACYHEEYYDKPEEQRHILLQFLNEDSGTGNSEIKKYILKDTGTEVFIDDTVGHYLSCLFAELASSLVMAIAAFQKIINTSDEKAINLFIALASDKIQFQKIDYKIVVLEGELSSIYTIGNGVSLFMFEVQHMLEHEVFPKKCKNCGEYFVPTGRKDARYCTYPSPQNKEKTCREIGARAARAKKEKEDDATREYRRKYMRLKMATRRNPDSLVANRKLEAFIQDAEQWQNKVKSGEVSESEYIEWLKKE